MTENPELNWAIDLGPIPEGDIELMEDAIEALESGHCVAIEHALHGLRKRVEAARSLAASPPLPQEQGAVPRVPLTADQIQDLWNPYAGAAPFGFARAIEAAHGIAPPVADPRQAQMGETK